LPNSEKLKSTLIALAARPTRNAPTAPKRVAVITPADPEAARDYLGRCYRQVMDAHSVEDAIFWHCEIINELSVQMHEARLQPWSEPAKATIIEALEERQHRHAKALDRLTGITHRNEQLIWR
jgi:hypothetical protein